MIYHDKERNVYYAESVSQANMKSEIVEWLIKQSIQYRTDARLAKRRKIEYIKKGQADALEAAAKFIEQVKIK